MITEKELIILKKSILLINEFKDNVHNINSGKEFITIHNRNIEKIIAIANERNSNFLKTKLNQYPKITIEHINEYIKINRNDISLLLLVFGFGFIFLKRFIKTGCVFPSQINAKILQITDVNKKILKVIENPYLEKLYQ